MRQPSFTKFLSQLRAKTVPKSRPRFKHHSNATRSLHQSHLPTTKDNLPVVPGDIYNYTSGRWLISEEAQLKQRFVKFDISNLCSLAATQFGSSTACIHIDKIEGNSNKALILTMDNGAEVVAKIPCPNAGPAVYMTSSEVATMKFLRRYTSIPVPDVYAWSSDRTNDVGAEYIIMENVDGVPLRQKWNAMTKSDRHSVIDRIIEMEKELECLEFPAYGSLFLRDSMPGRLKSYPLSPNLDPDGLFCVGPACTRSWCGEESSKAKVDTGPWTTFLDFAMSLPQHELVSIANSPEAIQNQIKQFDKEQRVEEYESFLERISAVLPILCQHPPVSETSRPVLWHSDLHFSNIFVSSDNPTKISGILDWQSSQLRPLFMQARFPNFLIPPKGYKPGAAMPVLPKNFKDLSTEDQEAATETKDNACLAKYYELRTHQQNKRVYNAMSFDRKLWEPFKYCQLFSHGSLVPAYNCLLRLERSWSSLNLPGECPYSLSKDELERLLGRIEAYEMRRDIWDIVQNKLCTDESGWVPNELWEVANEASKELYESFIESTVTNGDATMEEARAYWPFLPGR